MIEKHQQAHNIVRRYMWWTGGASLIPVLYLDGAAVSGLQLKMLADISKIYGVPFQENLGKAVIAALPGFILPHAAALGALATAIPGVAVLGAPLAVGFAATYSWALGNAFIQHFESGGNFLNLEPERFREHFKAQFARQNAAPAVEG